MFFIASIGFESRPGHSRLFRCRAAAVVSAVVNARRLCLSPRLNSRPCAAREVLAGANVNYQLRDFGAERVPRKGRVEAHDVAFGPVRNPAEDVPSRTISQRETHERAACVVDSALTESNHAQVSLKVFVIGVIHTRSPLFTT